MAHSPHVLDYEAVFSWLEAHNEKDARIELDAKKHRIIRIDQERNLLWEMRLPLPYPTLEGHANLETYLSAIPEEIPPYIIVLVQAGAAAMGYFEEGEVLYHKALKKYMKRHKRGKAQINYLNTRGKSKAGSRIRLANTIRFFEEINERLVDWMDDLDVERILFSCSAQMWGLLFQSKIPPPFEKKDPRLIKIPLDVRIPSHEELLRVNDFVLKGKAQEFTD